MLRDGDVIRLGSTVELEFRQPSPVSATARLAIVSRHRLPLAVDGVLLMAETCIVGGTGQAHIPAPALKDPVVLYRQGNALWCRAPGSFDVDGRTCAARAPLTLQSSVLGDGFSFSLEPLGRIRSNGDGRAASPSAGPTAWATYVKKSIDPGQESRRRDELTYVNLRKPSRPRNGTERDHRTKRPSTLGNV